MQISLKSLCLSIALLQDNNSLSCSIPTISLPAIRVMPSIFNYFFFTCTGRARIKNDYLCIKSEAEFTRDNLKR